MRTVLLLISLLVLTATILRADDYRFPLDTINHSLNVIGIDTSDVGFHPNWVDRDAFRLDLIDSLTRRPLGIPYHLKSNGDLLLDSTRSVLDHYLLLQSQLQNPAIVDRDSLTTWQQKTVDYFNNFIKIRRDCDSLAHYVSQTIFAIAATKQLSLLRELSPEVQHFLTDTFTVFLQEEEKDVDRPLEEMDEIQKYHEQLTIRFKNLSETNNLRGFAGVETAVITAHQNLVDWLDRNPDLVDRLAKCDLLSQFKDVSTPLGRVAVRGTGSDRYEGFFDLIIDFGGDDEYYPTRSADFRNQIIIDLSGHDRYFARSAHAIGAGFFSTGILDDWAGNDFYVSGDFSLGCGLFGTGILIDRAGDDTYKGNIGCQAASSFGVGLLLDSAGRDTYNAALYSQGFGFIMGASALIDRTGNDSYAAGWKYGDILRYEDHYISLSQGFGYGLRPYFSGGVGLLIDGAGNDQYAADIFGQGASYWYALGGLLDYGGNDNYIAYQYAQGAATHMCLATLIDITGDDLYSSKGVSQGCGHDVAFGLLLDCSGNDQYSATDLSQAAGSANGIGMLVDLSGDDGHIARVQTNTHGYGNPRREFGSIGLFLDLGGIDAYRGFGKDNTYWVTPSKWGIGVDLNSEAKK